jgi:hypothetical protein
MIKVLEYTWLFMSILGVTVTGVKIKDGESTQIGFFIFFTFIAVVMYLYRRRQRVMMDRAKAEDTSDKYH